MTGTTLAAPHRYRVVICGYLTMAGFILGIYANWSNHMRNSASTGDAAMEADANMNGATAAPRPPLGDPNDPSLYDWKVATSPCEWCAAHKVHLWCKGWAGKVCAEEAPHFAHAAARACFACPLVT